LWEGVRLRGQEGVVMRQKNVLLGSQKYALYKWADAHREECIVLSASALASKATRELQFPVTRCNIHEARKVVGIKPRRGGNTGRRSSVSLRALNHKILLLARAYVQVAEEFGLTPNVEVAHLAKEPQQYDKPIEPTIVSS